MISNQYTPIVGGIDLPTRCLCSTNNDENSMRFLAGTNSLNDMNEICLIEVLEESNKLKTYKTQHDKGQIWHISSSYAARELFSTCYRVGESKTQFNGTIWKYSISEATDELTLTNIYDIPSQTCKCIEWSENEKQSLLVLSNSLVSIYDFADGSNIKKVTSFEPCNNGAILCGVKWNPHNNSQVFSFFCGNIISSYDTRTNGLSNKFQACDSSSTILDMSYNPNVSEIIATVGTDSYLRFWDLRNTKKPIKSRKDHNHWVCCVRYNHTHDQLLVTSGSDHKVCLLNIPSVSSGPLLKNNAKSTENVSDLDSLESIDNKVMNDGVINVCDLHDDSVYSVEFARSYSWTYASISYDGRFVINFVPEEVRISVLI